MDRQCRHCSDFYHVVENLPTIPVLPLEVLAKQVGSTSHGPSPLKHKQSTSFVCPLMLCLTGV